MGRPLPVCAGLVAGLLVASSMAFPCSAQTSGYSSDAAAFVRDADHYVSLLHQGTTLGHWLDTRNRDAQWAENPEECASYFTMDQLPSGIWIPWKLYFYPPSAPSPVTFPDHASRRECVLGTVQVEAQTKTHGPYPANLFDAAAREVLTSEYGRSVGSEDEPFWGPYSYPNAARWISNAEIISGHSSDVSHCNDLHGPLSAMGDTAFVCAHSALVRWLELDLAHSYRYREIEDSQFHEALAIAGADPIHTEKLENLYKQISQGNAERLQKLFQQSVDGNIPPSQTVQAPTWLPSLEPLVQEWLGQLKTFPAKRRAAGLLAADHLLLAAQTAVAMTGWTRGVKEQWHLEKLSAELTPSETENGYYARSWAKQARELDPGGVVGQMAVIGFMAHESCDGQDSDDRSRKVILEGEKLLSAGLDAPMAAEVHFMVGDAYSDFVALAAQGLNAQGSPDANKFRGESEVDRDKALEHYRAGLAVDNSSQNAQDAWRQAWRLLAGIQPEERYVCFDEGGD